MEALAEVQHNVAELSVKWTRGSNTPRRPQPPTVASSGASPSFLHVRAEKGAEWKEFNATDFSRTELLSATASSDVKKLARAIGNEARRLGAVALHAYADDRAAVNTAVKAIASVPVELPGLHVRSVPSFGKAKVGDGERRVLRLYISSVSDASQARAQ